MNPVAVRTAAAIVRWYIRLLHRTQRLEVTGREHLGALPSEPVIFAHWHAQILLMARFMLDEMAAGRPIATIVSLSRDGDLTTRAVEQLGFIVHRGSTSRAGDAALRRLCRSVINQGTSTLIAVDGPRGPAGRSKPGAIALAQVTRAPIVPLGFATRQARRVRSWDRFYLPRPFGRIALAIGAPLQVPRELDDAARARWCETLDSTLERLSEEATSRL